MKSLSLFLSKNLLTEFLVISKDLLPTYFDFDLDDL